jgi:pilus assembly protein CpaF
VTGKANVVVAGAAGSGKTTFLRWLAGFIPPSERIITIEDTRELALNHPHVISLEASEKADIYDLMINSLRMRPDRIILGEVRGAEAFELLQAMGTGHEGSLTTVHANYGKMQAVHRLVRAMLRVGGVTPEELTAMIAETIDILVFVKRFSDGRRRLLHVSQVTSDEGRPVFRDLYRYRFQDDTHVAVGTVTAELAERLAENLEGQLPDIKALRGEMVA